MDGWSTVGGINSSDSTKSETEMFDWSTDANYTGSDETVFDGDGNGDGSWTGVTACNVDSVVDDWAWCDRLPSLWVSSVGVSG